MRARSGGRGVLAPIAILADHAHAGDSPRHPRPFEAGTAQGSDRRGEHRGLLAFSTRGPEKRQQARTPRVRAPTSQPSSMKHLSPEVLTADRHLSSMERLRLILEVCTLRLLVARMLRSGSDVRAAIGVLRRRVAEPQRMAADGAVAPLIDRLAWSSRTVLDRLPGDHPCLAQSLVLMCLLARRGVASRVVIGVRKDLPDGPLTAHAWVTVEGRAVSPPGDNEQLADL